MSGLVSSSHSSSRGRRPFRPLTLKVATFSASGCSLDYLIGPDQERLRGRDVQGFCGLEIDEQLGPGGLLDRQVRRFLALEDAAGIDAGETVSVRNAACVAHQAAGRGKLAVLVDRRQRVAKRQ